MSGSIFIGGDLWELLEGGRAVSVRLARAAPPGCVGGLTRTRKESRTQKGSSGNDRPGTTRRVVRTVCFFLLSTLRGVQPVLCNSGEIHILFNGGLRFDLSN